jgi:hypothetical protein
VMPLRRMESGCLPKGLQFSDCESEWVIGWMTQK